MIRLAWRQFRNQAYVALLAVVVVAVVAAFTRPHLVDIFSAATTTQPVLRGSYAVLQGALIVIVLAAPVLIGIFWGAPLVARELETGTFRLAWTQSVTRRRWLAGKLLLICACSIAAAGLLSLIVTWWLDPIYDADLTTGGPANRFSPLYFSAQALAPLGYGAFGFMLGVTGGVLFRRTLAAMATSLVGFAALRILVTYWVRPYFAPTQAASVPITSPMIDISLLKVPSGGMDILLETNMPNAWVYSTTVVDTAGNEVTRVSEDVVGSVGVGNVEALIAKINTLYHALVSYQPADRFWVFQGIELAVFLAFAIVLAALCFWWVRRRIS